MIVNIAETGFNKKYAKHTIDLNTDKRQIIPVSPQYM